MRSRRTSSKEEEEEGGGRRKPIITEEHAAMFRAGQTPPLNVRLELIDRAMRGGFGGPREQKPTPPFFVIDFPQARVALNVP